MTPEAFLNDLIYCFTVIILFSFRENTPGVGAFVIPAKAGNQECKMLSNDWIPDQQTSGMTTVDTLWLAAG